VDVDYPNVGKIKMFNNPVKFSDFEVEVRRPPMMGEHTDEIMEWCDYSPEEIAAFREKGII
jgi:formyl-CoA transferase